MTREEAVARWKRAKENKAATARRIIENMKAEHFAKTGVRLQDADFEVW